MALLKYGIAVAQLSGTVAGNVFARNKGGNYVRKWAKPTSTPTIKQSLTRSLFASANAIYRSLSSVDRESWEALAKISTFKNRLGEDITLSGISLFIKAQMPLLVANQTSADPIADLSAAPSTMNAPDPVKPIVTVATSVGTTSMAISAPEASVPAGVIFVVEATKDAPPSLINVSNKFVQIYAIAAAEDFDTMNLWSRYLAQFGEPSVGNRIVFRFRALDITNGMYSDAGLEVESLVGA